jgi:hypothetical protein
VTEQRHREAGQMERSRQARVTEVSILRLLAVYCLILTVVVGLAHNDKPPAAL